VHRSRSLLCLALALALSGCGAAGVPEITYEVAGSFPHQTDAYTQGLLFHDGFLYESTGQYGTSSLRKVNPQTGEVVQSIALDSMYFGEGLARVGDELFQLTWKENVGFVYDLETFELKREFAYDGHGWGLCWDGSVLWMSNGTGRLSARDPETFSVQREIQVTADGVALARLNELECVGDHIWANVYLSDRVVKIDKATGEVVGELDGFSLSSQSRRPPGDDGVLNGIAYVEETDVWLMTGKLWPTLFAVRITDQ